MKCSGIKICVPWGQNGFLHKVQNIQEAAGDSLHILFVHLWTCTSDLKIETIETTRNKERSLVMPKNTNHLNYHTKSFIANNYRVLSCEM